MKLLDETIASVPIARLIPTDQTPQGLCLDRGYDYDVTRESVIAQRFVPHIRARGQDIPNQLHDPDWKPRRWVVEACHSWLNRNRAILIRWSKNDENHLALLQLASGLIAFKKAHAAQLAAALPG
jgi:putative transposase